MAIDHRTALTLCDMLMFPAMQYYGWVGVGVTTVTTVYTASSSGCNNNYMSKGNVCVWGGGGGG